MRASLPFFWNGDIPGGQATMTDLFEKSVEVKAADFATDSLSATQTKSRRARADAQTACGPAVCFGEAGL
jgi:hypothetical protein